VERGVPDIRPDGAVRGIWIRSFRSATPRARSSGSPASEGTHRAQRTEDTVARFWAITRQLNSTLDVDRPDGGAGQDAAASRRGGGLAGLLTPRDDCQTVFLQTDVIPFRRRWPTGAACRVGPSNQGAYSPKRRRRHADRSATFQRPLRDRGGPLHPPSWTRTRGYRFIQIQNKRGWSGFDSRTKRCSRRCRVVEIDRR